MMALISREMSSMSASAFFLHTQMDAAQCTSQPRCSILTSCPTCCDSQCWHPYMSHCLVRCMCSAKVHQGCSATAVIRQTPALSMGVPPSLIPAASAHVTGSLTPPPVTAAPFPSKHTHHTLAAGSPLVQHLLVGVHLEGPALHHFLGDGVGDDQHQLLQPPRSEPLCGGAGSIGSRGEPA